MLTKTKQLVKFAVTAFVALIVIEWLFPSVMPFAIFEFWKQKESLWSAIKFSWPLFIWVIVFEIAISRYLKKHSNEKSISDLKTLLNNRVFNGIGAISLYSQKISNERLKALGNEIVFNNIGTIIVEEIFQRWLVLLNIIWGVKLLDWLIFGWLGFGIFQWLYMNWAAPIASFSTLGMIDSIIYHPFGWSVGYSMMTISLVNTWRHENQGIFGRINCWYIELYLFYAMFQFGLMACIAIHFLYNTIFYCTRYWATNK